MAGMGSPNSQQHRRPEPALHRPGLAGLRPMQGWELHPGVRSGDRLSRGERFADLARDRLGSWNATTVGAVVLVAGIAMSVRRDRADTGTVLAVVLCGLVFMDLSLVLMVVRRADRTASELALYELESARRSAATIADLRDEVDALRVQVARLAARVQTSGEPDHAGGDSS
jgi:hypothetical protein